MPCPMLDHQVWPMRFCTSPDMQTRSPSSGNMAPIVAALLAALSVLLNSTLALAQDSHRAKNLTDMSLEELMSVRIDSVYGASGFKQKVTEAPASVTIITSEDIQRYGYRTVADILRNVPGKSMRPPAMPSSSMRVPWTCGVLNFLY